MRLSQRVSVLIVAGLLSMPFLDLQRRGPRRVQRRGLEVRSRSCSDLSPKADLDLAAPEDQSVASRASGVSSVFCAQQESRGSSRAPHICVHQRTSRTQGGYSFRRHDVPLCRSLALRQAV